MSDISVVPSDIMWDRLSSKFRPFTDFEKYGDYRELDWRIRPFSLGLREAWIVDILNRIDAGAFESAGRVGAWDEGWEEIRQRFFRTDRLEDLRPQYLYNSQIMRLNGELVLVLNPEFEYNWYQLLLAYIFDKYIKPHRFIYEFGCGTGHNLAAFWRWDTSKDYCGFDWSRPAVELVERIAPSIRGAQFDFFVPFGTGEQLAAKSAILTIGALEQTGQRYKEFFGYLLAQRPAVVIHIEPIIEWYDETNLVDYTAIRYHKARGYWTGFPEYMHTLSNDGKIRLIEARRFGVGSKYLEGYMLWAWRPV